MKEPCPGCAAPYGYKNAMPLSTDTYLFSVSLCCRSLFYLFHNKFIVFLYDNYC